MKKTFNNLQAGMISFAATLSKSEKLHLDAYRKAPENYKIFKRLIKSQNKNTYVVSRLQRAMRLIAECPKGAENLVLDNLSASTAQLLQDVFCLVCTNGKKDGYFVEVGVGDGVHLSNSYMLESRFGWNGILVEPCRSFHERISSSRRAKLDTSAAGALLNGKVLFREIPEMGELSHFEDSSTGKKINYYGAIEYEVNTTTLNQILTKAGAPNRIDFLSIDTEGSELDILAGVDFAQFEFSVLAIEHNDRPEELARLDQLLQPHGYSRVLSGVSKFDAWYVHSKLQPDKFTS